MSWSLGFQRQCALARAWSWALSFCVAFRCCCFTLFIRFAIAAHVLRRACHAFSTLSVATCAWDPYASLLSLLRRSLAPPVPFLCPRPFFTFTVQQFRAFGSILTPFEISWSRCALHVSFVVSISCVLILIPFSPGKESQSSWMASIWHSLCCWTFYISLLSECRGITFPCFEFADQLCRFPLWT